jgi:hypothetical protein
MAFSSASACNKQAQKQAARLLTCAQGTRVTDFRTDPAGQLFGPSPDVQAVLGIRLDDVVPLVRDVYTDVTVDPGLSMTMMVVYTLRYQTVVSPVPGGKAPPGPYEGSPFLVEVRRMAIDPTDHSSLVPDPEFDPAYYLLPYTAYTVDPLATLPGQFAADGQLPLGPYTAAARAVHLRFSVVLFHDATDWNSSAPTSGGWVVPIAVAPFATIDTELPIAVSFDVRFG